MRNNEAFIQKLQEDERFHCFTQPVEADIGEKVRDAEFLLRKDGLLINVEGWNHPQGHLVGEVLYVPDVNSDKRIFGQPYRKITLYNGTYEPIPYQERAEILSEIDSRLNQVKTNPYFAKYKQIFPHSDFVAYFPSHHALKIALERFTLPTDNLPKDLENIMSLLAINTNEITLGLTGVLLLGNVWQYHDLDIVFMGSLDQNRHIANRMRDIISQDKHRRLFEGRKGWSIRFFNDYGHLMCTFFGYRDIAEAPLRNFEMKVIQENVTIEGTVSDDTHSMYTPTILQLGDISFETSVFRHPDDFNNQQLELIIYHTASRGDCVKGDRIRAHGALVEVTRQETTNSALCVIDREGVKNLTPLWTGYYAENFG